MEVRAHPPLAVAQDDRGGWRIFISMGDMFDDYIPFREALDEIVELLSEQAPALLTLPQYKDEENFVEGAIQWKNGNIGVYFETWDAYLLLHSRSRELLDAALPLIISKAKIRE